MKSKKKYTQEFKDQVLALVELGKPPAEVATLIAGPGIYICDECVNVCGEILANELPDWPKFLLCPNDPLKATHDMLKSMRDASEISEQVFTTRLAEAVVREFSPRQGLPTKVKPNMTSAKSNASF